MRIGCLHTAQSNAAVLERAAEAFGRNRPTLEHMVRPDLLAAVGLAGALTPQIIDATRQALDALAGDCDAVLLTCSSLGPVADLAARVPTIRVDRALAEQAATHAGTIVVLCAAPSTLEPTGDLFKSVAGEMADRVDVRLVPHAWALFLAGDLAGYRAMIEVAAQQALDDAGCVALAQVSMADCAVRSPRLLTSPSVGLAAAMHQASMQ